MAITLHPIADALVYEGAPDHNYGPYGDLSVRTRDGQNARSFLMFWLGGLPAGAEITLATLRLNCYSTSNLIPGVSDVQARRTDDSWSEYGITWKNSRYMARGIVEDTTPPAVGWVEWTVTPFIQAEYAGDRIASFCMTCVQEWYDGATRNSSFRSKEYDGNDPELYIEYTLPPYVNSVTISAPSSHVEDSAFTISGYVRDQYGDGMGGITVYLYRDGSYIGVAGTSSSGYYAKSHTIYSPGTYELTARADSKEASRTITITKLPPYVKSITISAPSSCVEGVPFKISGYVRDQYGDGMGGITVYLYRNGSYIGSDGTSSLGYYSKWYSISTAGVYTLKAIADSKSASRTITITKPPPYVKSITISAPSSHVEDSAFTISGTVKDQYGARMGGVYVYLYQNGSHFATVTTNSIGNYSRSRTIYSPGTYELAAKADTKWAYRNITITEKIVTVGTTITLNLSKPKVKPSEIFTWYGNLSRDDGGKPGSQTIRLLLNGTTVDSTTCDVNGNFSATETAPSSDGYYSYRSHFKGATLALERLEASMSPEKRLWRV